MKHFFALLLFLFAVVVCHSQSIDSTIMLTTNKGMVYKGQLLEDIKDVYVQMKAEDGRVYVFSYPTIREVKNSSGRQLYYHTEAPDTAVSAPIIAGWDDSLYTIDKDINHWRKAQLIKEKDTLLVKVEPRKNYCIPRAASGRKNTLLIVHKNDSLERIPAEEISELLVLNDFGVKRYIASPDTNIEGLYLTMMEGKCMLLYNERDGTVAGVIGYVAGGIIMGIVAGILTEKLKPRTLLLCYGNILYDLGKGFKNKCRMAFSECPALVQKIESEEYTIKNIEFIVSEFNTCIGKKW